MFKKIMVIGHLNHYRNSMFDNPMFFVIRHHLGLIPVGLSTNNGIYNLRFTSLKHRFN